jgi:hypothetical protein
MSPLAFQIGFIMGAYRFASLVGVRYLINHAGLS